MELAFRRVKLERNETPDGRVGYLFSQFTHDLDWSGECGSDVPTKVVQHENTCCDLEVKSILSCFCFLRQLMDHDSLRRSPAQLDRLRLDSEDQTRIWCRNTAVRENNTLTHRQDAAVIIVAEGGSPRPQKMRALWSYCDGF
ncbi:hypothetical protein J6590_005635 [Homalodisca vitripennis]|nr:hypothetical protein J6590_005635 [Homalodisca vitripennis]